MTLHLGASEGVACCQDREGFARMVAAPLRPKAKPLAEGESDSFSAYRQI